MYAYLSKRRRLYKEDSDEENSDENPDNLSDVGSEEFNLLKTPEIYIVHDEPDIEDSAGATQLKKGLFNVLSRTHKEKASEFAVGNRSAELPTSPGIKISGYGTVSLPVTEMTVKDLKKHFQQAPYGLGEDTLIDKAVRDSWQLDPEKFEITNPKFNAGVEKLVKEIQDGLGCEKQKVTSHLYKLLLYEPGGHFKPHRDTEKHPGMFATLIIQVPSIFTGGDLVVKHGTEEKRIAFGTPESEFTCVYAAHYADCEHELTEITFGYRMALVYSLCWDGNGVVPSPPDIPTTKLAGLLKQLDPVLPLPHMIAWGLDHHYSQKSLLRKGVQALKGGDKVIYSAVQGANAMLEEDKKVDCFILDAKRIENLYGSCTRECDGWYGRYRKRNGDSGDCFDDEGESETDYKFKPFCTDGKPLKHPPSFRLNEKRYVLNVGEDDDEFWGKCNEGKCSGPSGNEGASKTNWYRRYVLVIFPKGNAFKVLYKNDVEFAIRYLEEQLESEGASSTSVKRLASDIVDLSVHLKQRFCKRSWSVVSLLKVSVRMKELDFAKKILSLLSEPIVAYDKLVSTNPWHYEQWKQAFGIPSEEMASILQDLISAFSWQQLSDPLTRLIETCPPKHYKHATTFLEQCPDDVPKEKLLVSMVGKAVNSGEAESRLTDEGIMEIGSIILSHPKSCSSFIQPFLDLSKLQNLQMLINLLSFLTKNNDKAIEENQLYAMTCTRFCEEFSKISCDGGLTSALEDDEIEKSAKLLVRMQETTLLKKLVEDILQNPSTLLLQTVILGCLGQSDNVSQPVKRLIAARIKQLLPIVQAGELKYDWCQPTAVIPGHPEVQAFLRGPERKFVYRRFTGKGQATKFERDYFRERQNVVVNVLGSRSNTVVEITKIPANAEHDRALRKYNVHCKELELLQAKLGKKSV